MDWQVMGFGNFSGRGENDMILRNVNNGGVEVYDLSNNQITNAAFMGTVGLNWQFSGVGNFSGVGGETDLLLRNSVFCRRRHQPRRPVPARIRPGSPAPTMGPGTRTPEMEVSGPVPKKNVALVIVVASVTSDEGEFTGVHV